MNGRDAWDHQGFASEIFHSGSSNEDEGEKRLLREQEEEKNTEGKKAERGRKLRGRGCGKKKGERNEKGKKEEREKK